MRLSWDPTDEELSDIKIQVQRARPVTIRVTDHEGNPVTDATAGLTYDFGSLGTQVVDQQGQATLLIPADVEVECVFAISRSAGVDYRSFVLPREQRGDANAKKPELPDDAIELRVGKTRACTITVVDDDGQPVVGIGVYPWLMQKAGEPDSFNVSSVAKVALMQTDDSGMVRFDWIPDWPTQYLSFFTLSEEYTTARADFRAKSESSEATIIVSRKVSVQGVVRHVDGTPAVDLPIRFHGRGLRQGESSGMSDGVTVYSDSLGRFHMRLAPGHAYIGQVQDDQWRFAEPVVFAIGREPPARDLELTVRKPTRVFGRVTVGADKRPVANHYIRFTEYAEMEVPILGGEGTYEARPSIGDLVTTNDAGQYEFLTGSGTFWIRGSSQSDVTCIAIDDESEKEVNFHSQRPERGMLAGRVVDAEGAGVADLEVEGIYASDNASGRNFTATTDPMGEFRVERELQPAVAIARSADGSHAAIMEIAPDDTEIEFRLVPTVTATGRLVDAEGKALDGEDIRFGRRVYQGEPGDSPFSDHFGNTVTTDEQGQFALPDLVPGINYHVSLVIEKEDGYASSWFGISQVQPEPGKATLELGDVVYQRRSAPALTTEEKISRAFSVETPPVQRMQRATARASQNHQLVLILFADPADPHSRQFGELQFEDREVGQLLYGFVTMAIDSSEQKFATASELAKTLDIELQHMDLQLQLVLADQDGNAVAHIELPEISVENPDGVQIDRTKLIRVLTEHTPQPLDARELLDEALAQAMQQDKRVIVQVTATWCGPCHLLANYLEGTREIWSEDFIWVKMDHRWTGARDLMAELRDGADGGIPWVAILDADGAVLETSNDQTGDNIGFPGKQTSRVYFRNMILRTAQRLTDDQITELVAPLMPKTDTEAEQK